MYFIGNYVLSMIELCSIYDRTFTCKFKKGNVK